MFKLYRIHSTTCIFKSFGTSNKLFLTISGVIKQLTLSDFHKYTKNVGKQQVLNCVKILAQLGEINLSMLISIAMPLAKHCLKMNVQIHDQASGLWNFSALEQIKFSEYIW